MSQEKNETQRHSPEHIAKAFRIDPEKTARPEVRMVGRHAVVGEYHLRLKGDEQSDQQLKEIVASADVVVVEFDSRNSGYENATEHQRFMSMAQAGSQDKKLVIMDDLRPSGIDAWYAAGITISPENYRALVSLECAQYPVMGMIANSSQEGVDRQQITEEVADLIRKKIPDMHKDMAYLLAEGAARGLMLSATLGVREVFNMIDMYLRVDSYAREVNYQRIIANEVKNAGEKKVVVVVGMAHLNAAEEALSGQFSSKKVKDEVLEKFSKADYVVTAFSN